MWAICPDRCLRVHVVQRLLRDDGAQDGEEDRFIRVDSFVAAF